MKKLIALKGAANHGKTSTIKKVYKLLIEKYNPTQVEYFIKNAEIRAVITINGIKIGIESHGDPSSRLFESLKLFVEIECDIILCATRTRGGTVDAVKKLSTEYDIEWISKLYESDPEKQKSANKDAALAIIKKIENVLRGSA